MPQRVFYRDLRAIFYCRQIQRSENYRENFPPLYSINHTFISISMHVIASEENNRVKYLSFIMQNCRIIFIAFTIIVNDRQLLSLSICHFRNYTF